jgi:hypothetical protein
MGVGAGAGGKRERDLTRGEASPRSQGEWARNLLAAPLRGFVAKIRQGTPSGVPPEGA